MMVTPDWIMGVVLSGLVVAFGLGYVAGKARRGRESLIDLKRRAAATRQSMVSKGPGTA